MSTNLDLSALTRFKDVPAGAKTSGWAPPAAEDFLPGVVLAFDQSFSATGWVVLSNIAGRMSVEASGTYRTPPGDKRGAEQDLDRAQALYEKVSQILRWGFNPSVVVYETPPKGAGVRHPEVSLLCALAIRLAAEAHAMPHASIHSTTCKRMITGNAKADKKQAHDALRVHGPGLVAGFEKHITNEATRDALLVALTHLKENR